LECSTVENKDIAALLESLCERPMAGSQAEPSVELLAVGREALNALSPGGDAPARPNPGDIEDADRLTAALAALLSGADTEAARRTVEDAALRSAAVRLDSQSAIAFVDAIEQSPLPAPAHLIDEILAADHAGGARSAAPHPSAGPTNIWSLIASGSWSTRRLAAAGMVLLLVGAASWSLYWQGTNPAVEGGPAPPTANGRPAVANAPAPAKPALATTQPCGRPGLTSDPPMAQSSALADGPKPADSQAAADCAPMPGNQLADRPADETGAIAARQRAEAARQAAAARSATDAAGKVGAAQSGREPSRGTINADHSGPMFGATGHNPPAALRTAPAAAPAAPRPPRP
jgi:hypothetical protein